MPVDPETRARLMDLLEERRLELGLTWREVVERAGMSYEAIRNFRTGTGGMRELTRRKLSEALEWDRGAVGRVLAGEPLHAPPADDTRPDVVREHWDDDHVRNIWERLPRSVTTDQRLALIAGYLKDAGHSKQTV